MKVNNIFSFRYFFLIKDIIGLLSDNASPTQCPWKNHHKNFTERNNLFTNKNNFDENHILVEVRLKLIEKYDMIRYETL